MLAARDAAPVELQLLFKLFNAGRHAEMEAAAAALLPALGIVLRQLGQFAAAADSLRLATRWQPGQTEAALPSLREALRIHPGFAEAHFHLAHALKTLSRTDEALVHLQAARRQAPDDLAPRSECLFVPSRIGLAAAVAVAELVRAQSATSRGTMNEGLQMKHLQPPHRTRAGKMPDPLARQLNDAACRWSSPWR